MESHMRRHDFEFQSGAQEFQENNDFDDFFGAEPNEEKVYFEDFTTTTQEDAPSSRQLNQADKQNLAIIEAEISELVNKTNHYKVFNGDNC